MSEYTVKDFVQEAEKQNEFYKEQISKFDKILEDYTTKSNELKSRKNSVLDKIVSFVMPEFNQENLEKFSQKVNKPNLVDMIKIMNKEESILKQRISEIEKIDDFQKREALLDPTSGVIITQVNEIKPLFNQAKTIYDKLNSFSGFSGLIERKWGTSSYPHQGMTKYLKSEFLKDWKNSDLIVEEMKAKDFIDIINQYEQAEMQVKTFGENLKDLNNQIKNIKDLTSEYNERTESLKNLKNSYLNRIKNVIVEDFKNDKEVSVKKFSDGNTDIENEFKKLDGLDHQIDYFDSLSQKVVEDRNKIVERSGKLNEEAQRYQMDESKYRNKVFTDEQFEKRFDRDESRYDNMYNRYDRYGNTLYGFDGYYRGSFVTDLLWWDLIADGRLDGHFIPGVHDYYNTHPNYSYDSTSSSSDNS